MNKGGSAPQAPDYQKLLQQQAQYNRINQYTPYGSLEYKTNAQMNGGTSGPVYTPVSVPAGGGGSSAGVGGSQNHMPLRAMSGEQRWNYEHGVGVYGNGGGQAYRAPDGSIVNSVPAGAQIAGQSSGVPTNAVLSLKPEIQKAFDRRNEVIGNRLQNLPDSNFSGDVPSVGGTGAGSMGPFDQSTQAQKAQFDQAMSLLQPQLDQQQRAEEQKLANQGLPMGSEAYNQEMNRFDRQRTQALNDAAYRAVGAGNQRQNQLFHQGLSALGARQNIRNQNLNEINALLKGNQVQTPSLGQFYQPSNVDVTGAAGLQQSAANAAYQANQQQNSAMMGGLAQLGAAYLMA